ncbi:hypothetical protein Scep_028113 [Stephania cephalantha]|uniref:Uncharacterized protein n=1 Tax=Stephania cephalantha TaxID=152367 RepID=A0AAP0E9B0_9MAGN
MFNLHIFLRLTRQHMHVRVEDCRSCFWGIGDKSNLKVLCSPLSLSDLSTSKGKGKEENAGDYLRDCGAGSCVISICIYFTFVGF